MDKHAYTVYAKLLLQMPTITLITGASISLTAHTPNTVQHVTKHTSLLDLKKTRRISWAALGWHLPSIIFMKCNCMGLKLIPFHPHEVISLFGGDTAPARRCPFVKLCITSEYHKENVICVSLPALDSSAGVAYNILSVKCPGALCYLTLPLLLPPTLSSWSGLSDITLWQREPAARSSTFLCWFQLYLSGSFRAWQLNVYEAKSAKWPLEKDKFVMLTEQPSVPA